jgi:hypothetical protein
MHIENIVLSNAVLDPFGLLSNGTILDWEFEKEQTLFNVDETFLPRILVLAGIAPSTSEVKRNHPNLWRDVPEGQFTEVKWGKRRLFIVS